MGSPGFLRTDRVWVSHYMVRPFPHVKAWGGTAQITMQGHRGTLFSGRLDRFQISGNYCTQLLQTIRLREDHSDEKITHHEVGWSPLRNHPVNVRGGQVSDWEESQVLAALAVCELSAALQ
jgi:hypothetical protein